jgi:hypothetical protein
MRHILSVTGLGLAALLLAAVPAVPGVRSVMSELVYLPQLLMGPARHSGRRRREP